MITIQNGLKNWGYQKMTGRSGKLKKKKKGKRGPGI